MQVPGFQVLRRIGGGGVGEVFHAVRVGPGGFRKPVALKRLKLDHAIDSRMVQRFFTEARISAQLEHPNLVRVDDLLAVDEGYFIVMELLRGHTLAELRDRVTPMPWWLPFAVAEQALAGLEHVHALRDEDGRPLGLVHRDLTPRNLFVCDGGVVKILDFGIAKLRHALTQGLTRDGVALGTLEFLSPEQARGEPVDARTDLYQLAGAVYWALTGEFPHGTGTPAELVARAIGGEVKPLGALRHDVPERAAAVIGKAMSPRAEDRPPDAAAMRAELRAALRDAAGWGPEAIAAAVPASPPPPPSDPGAFEAAASAVPVSTGLAPAVPVSPHAPTVAHTPSARAARPWRRRALAASAVAAAAIAAVAIVWATGDDRAASGATPEYRRLTFQRGTLFSARFAPDGESVVYSAAWGLEGTRTYLAAPDKPEARSLDLPGAEVLAVARDGTLAVIRDVTVYGYSRRGRLARASLKSDAAPRDLLDDVERADFAGDGETMAVVRWVAERPRLEFPVGTVLYEPPAAGWIGDVRISPRGDAVAFLEHPMVGDDRGRVAIVDPAGVVTNLTGEYTSIQGLAWSRSRDELLFTAAEGGPRALYAVGRDGRARNLERAPTHLTLLDVAPDGRVLVRQDVDELRTIGQAPGAPPRDLSWLNFSFPTSISEDGQWVAMMESGSEVASGPSVYLRRLDGSAPAVLVSERPGGLLSPDGRWLLAGRGGDDPLQLVPTGAGEPRPLPALDVGDLVTGDWSVDGRKLFLFAAREQRLAAYVYDVESGGLHTVPRDKIRFVVRSHMLAPDGERAVVIDETTERLAIVRLADGALTAVAGAEPGENFASWSADGKTLYVAKMSTAPLAVFQLDPVTGERTPWRDLMPEDPVGVEQITSLELTRDARAYAYAYHRVLSTLYLVEGAR